MGKSYKGSNYNPNYQKKMSTEEKDFIQNVDFHIKNVKDTYFNQSANLGLNSTSLTNSGGFSLTRFSFNYQMLTALYRNNWIANKVCRIPAVDMYREIPSFNSELDPEKIKKIDRFIKKLKNKLIDGTTWGRLYGGAIAIPIIKGVTDGQKGGNSILEQPFNENYITPDSFRGIYILDRWRGVSPQDLETDINSPRYGNIKSYIVQGENLQSMNVHWSWILEFNGLQLPRVEKNQDTYWGMSNLEILIEELRKYEGTNHSVAELVYKSSLRVLKIKGLQKASVGKSKAFQDEINRRIATIQELQSSQKILALDSEEDFAVNNVSFGSLDKIMEEFKKNISGAAEIPMSKLFGIMGEGMSGEDKTSLTNYYDFIAAENERLCRPIYDKLLLWICKSEFGETIEDLDYNFKYLGDISDKKSIEKGIQKINVIIEMFKEGLITQVIAIQEVKEIGKEIGLGTNITDAFIKKIEAEEKYQLPSEQTQQEVTPEF
jgi:phage-related protein (TIGR01555 family)